MTMWCNMHDCTQTHLVYFICETVGTGWRCTRCFDIYMCSFYRLVSARLHIFRCDKLCEEKGGMRSKYRKNNQGETRHG